MKAIDKKMWRELADMRLQALAIALVIVGGVAVFVMSLSTLDSLYETRETYYRQNRFAHIFVSMKRAPLSVVRRIEEIPGVDKVEARVVAYVSVDVPGYADPVSAHLVSLPAQSYGLLNRLYLREGRLIEPGRNDEVVVSDEFGRAHGLHPGSRLQATINGRRKTLIVVGRAQSPEYMYQIAPGAMFPDYERYGVFWMAQKPLATAYDMDGAFNNAVLTISREAVEQDVIDHLDTMLRPYGATGAYARKDQLSHRFLAEELKQQQTVATVFPIIFFGVAAFLLNVVVSRLVSLQREEIGTLKAFGYSNVDVGLHYVKLILLITGFGIAGGILVGVWMGRSLSDIYMEFFSLPFMIYVLRPAVILGAAVISSGVAIIGTLYAVYGAVRINPAEAMRPELPAAYHATLIERLGLQRLFSQPTRMILRHIERRPLKSTLTMFGIALACGVMLVSGFQEGAINQMVEVQYGMSRQEDLLAAYTEPTSGRSVYSLRSIDGVQRVEGFREVPARLRFEHRSYRTSLQGVADEGRLFRLLDNELRPIIIPGAGIFLNDYLADLLRVEPGQMLTVEVLEGDRPVLQVPVAGTARQDLGMNAYMARSALNRVLGEGDVTSGALLEIDDRYRDPILSALKGMPRIAGVVEQTSAVKAFYDNVARTILFFNLVVTILGASIAFGVVYNSMRISLSERSRELASLRVLGFERGEIAYILLGELALLTVAAIPIGFLIGYGLCGYLAFKFDTDLYRIPLVIGPNVFAFAALVVVASSVVSAAVMWRQLGRLDMVAVLKSKE